MGDYRYVVLISTFHEHGYITDFLFLSNLEPVTTFGYRVVADPLSPLAPQM